MAFIRPTSSVVTSYSTTFTGNENPLSEGGKWIQPVPSIFTNAVQKSGGFAIDGGTATGFNDAVATLVYGTWTGNLRLTSTLHIGGAIGAAEVEFHCNTTYNATQLFLYETDFTNGGMIGVKWLGDQSSIFILPATGGLGGWVGSVPPSNGDIIIQERTDNGTVVTINVWQKISGVSTLVYQYKDSLAISGTAPYLTGQPGIGFDNGGGSSNFALDDLLVETF